jgi:hypothetical protein
MPKSSVKQRKRSAPARSKSGVRIARTKVGRGVFAERWFEESEVVGEIDGEIIDDVSYSSDYCMDLGDDRSLEPAAPFRFINHSCQPNCELCWFDVKDKRGKLQRRMYVMATRRIADGDELTIDYAWPAEMAIPCRCGSSACRQWIVKRSDLKRVVAGTRR